MSAEPMKLTLRVLLAYLDGILPKEDQAAVAKMIEDSQVARQILERLRLVVRNPELAAPPVSGPDLRKWDPNRVAEYLDRVLPEDKVTEFERFCLHSDKELAELVGAHHALSLVLRGAPEFDKATRERMYAVLHEHGEAESAEASERAAFEDAPVTEDGVQTMGGGGLIETADHEKSAAEMLGVDGSAPAAVKNQANLGEKEHHERVSVPDEVRQAAAQEQLWRRAIPLVALLVLIGLGGAIIMAIRGTGIAENNDPTAPVGAGLADDPDQPAEPEPRQPDEPPPSENGEPNDTDPVEPLDPDARLPSEQMPAEPTEAPPAEPGDEPEMPEMPETPAEAPPEPLPPATTDDEPADDQPADEPPPAEPPVPRVEVGHYASTGSVLFHAKQEDGREVWKRLAPRSRILSGDRLAALNSFRPAIELTEAVRVELLGGARADLLPPDEEGTPGVAFSKGRMVVTPLAGPAVFRLAIFDETLRIELAEGATLGVELVPTLLQWSDNPEQSGRRVDAVYYLASGSMQLVSSTGTLSVPAGPANGTLIPLQSGTAEVPEWVIRNDFSPIEKRAADRVEGDISTEHQGAWRLLEITQSEATQRQVEIRMLALRGLATLGDYRPVAEALGSEGLSRPQRDELIDELRAAIARSPEHAERVKEAFLKVNPNDGDLLYRMLWGFNDTDLARGADAQLVGMLIHPDLTHRVLAIWNLRQINAGRSLLYDPTASPADRAAKHRSWEDRLKQGAIRWNRS